jgi:hypothetical protein
LRDTDFDVEVVKEGELIEEVIERAPEQIEMHM